MVGRTTVRLDSLRSGVTHEMPTEWRVIETLPSEEPGRFILTWAEDSQVDISVEVLGQESPVVVPLTDIGDREEVWEYRDSDERQMHLEHLNIITGQKSD